MASSEQIPPPASVVGNAFVCQYYHILYQSPDLGHRFYQDISKLSRPEEDGKLSTTTTLQAINEKILSMRKNDPDCKTEIASVDSVDSYNGGVFVLVSGFMTGKGCSRRKFSQTFFLAPQDKGYFVLNDILRYVDESPTIKRKHDDKSPNQGKVDVYQASSTTEAEAKESEQFAAPEENASGEEVYDPQENAQENKEVEGPEPDVANEVPDDSQDVIESTTGLEDMRKKSYTSIVKVSPALSSPPASSGIRTASKTQDQKVVTAPVPVNVSEALASSTRVDETGYKQETEAEGCSIYLGGLPQNVTPALVENEFKKFGPIKTHGVQVKVQKGFCFGFVEFETPGAVQSALEASPIMINGRKVFVEEKRSTNRGNVRGWFSSGRGAVTGYRTEGPRGRGNFNNGWNFGRDDFHGRSDYGNRSRGGSSYHGSNGFARGDQMGSHGSRSNRTGSISKSSFERVPAPV